MNLLRMSFSAAIIIMVIIILRALWIHKLPKKMFLILWSVVVLRLLIPFSFPSMFSVYSLIPQSSTESIENQLVWGKGNEEKGKVTGSQEERGQNQYQENTSTSTIGEGYVPVWMVVWVMGMSVCIMFFSVTYILCCRRFQASLPVKNDMLNEWMLSHKIRRKISVRQSDYISAPLAYGFFHPVILMPKGIKWENSKQLQYVLEHEFIHIRRLDAVAKLFLIAAVCIHWFNPMVWVMYVLANRDIELSCDEGVIRHFGEDSKSAYALSLIHMEEMKSSLMPFGNNFSKNAAEERITAIMKLKKLSVPAYVLAAGLVISVIAAFATSAVSAEQGSAAGKQAIVGIETELLESQQKELLKVYQKYGVSEKNGILLYKNKPIRLLADKYLERTSNGNGGTNTNTIRVYTYFNEAGTVDVKPIRENKIGKTKITELFKDVTDIVNIMPTAVENRLIDIPQECVNMLARKAVEEGRYASARKMARYIDKYVMYEIAERMVEEGERIDEMAPYISADVIGNLTENAYRKWGLSFVRDLLPYVPLESLQRLGNIAREKKDDTAMIEIGWLRLEKM